MAWFSEVEATEEVQPLVEVDGTPNVEVESNSVVETDSAPVVNENSSSVDTNNVTITKKDVEDAVSVALSGYYKEYESNGFNRLAKDFADLGNSIVTLVSDSGSNKKNAEQTTYVVKLEPDQASKLTSGARVACTEGLLVVLLLALLCGLRCFEIFTRKWGGNG